MAPRHGDVIKREFRVGVASDPRDVSGHRIPLSSKATGPDDENTNSPSQFPDRHGNVVAMTGCVLERVDTDQGDRSIIEDIEC